MELMRGGELFERIAKKGPLPENECVEAFRGLLTAVNYLHSLGIAHRDLKPENMLFEVPDNGSVKIVDFGFAKYDQECAPLQTPIGTAAYAAPEVLLEQQYSKSVDIWSIGCVLYFMLFGRPPFYSENDEELEELAASGVFEFPVKPAVSDQAKLLISALLEKEPSKRLTASQALSHPWLKTKTTNTTISTSSTVTNSPSNTTTPTTTSSDEQQKPNPDLSSNLHIVKKSMNKAIDSIRADADDDEECSFELEVVTESPLWKSRQSKDSPSNLTQTDDCERKTSTP
eukprot:TRINITY_DN10454_c0_g1_i1.p1 TRINITY_DN10454_c0_g1~~TRINITY_DN10454_c0_g1_i1.p1  ORF type:complete len:286 (-),score=53.73 TRINITY_DN10454_c0_g1_i1:31-888(-)